MDFLRVHDDETEQHLDEFGIKPVRDAPALEPGEQGLFTAPVIDRDGEGGLDAGQAHGKRPAAGQEADQAVVDGVDSDAYNRQLAFHAHSF